MSTKLAVDLHRVNDHLFLGQLRIVLRPGLAEKTGFFSQSLPEFSGEVRRERRQQQDQLALGVAKQLGRELAGRNLRFRAIQLVDELHDGRHAGIEVPASLEVVSNALDCLVKLALNLAGSG